MCTQPILIRNKRLQALDVKVSNSFIKVPCGYCEECLKKRSNDIYVRARFEAQSCLASGGSAFMCTLTYDNKHLPYFDHEGKKYMVFNKRDLILFFKRLRIRLDRFFNDHYSTSAPDFKYLVTSEYGSDPTRTHRPHYHLLFFFSRAISLFAFRMCFKQSLVGYFGKVFQCDPLDLSRGGVRYVCKYILKDVTYSSQDSFIRDYIKSASHYVNAKHGIVEFPKSQDDIFRNKCIRSSKSFKDDIERFVRPYRHMLQFYMCSNDFGLSAIVNYYGESLYSLSLLSIDYFPYSIPKQVSTFIERKKGFMSRDLLVKSIFEKRFDSLLSLALKDGIIDNSKRLLLSEFVHNFIQPRYGSLYFISPSSSSYYDRFFNLPLSFDRSLFDDFSFYDDNSFFEFRNEVISLVNLYNTSSELVFREKVAFLKSSKERYQYVQKKLNNSYKYAVL